MSASPEGLRVISILAVAVGVLTGASTASADWIPVAGVPASEFFSIRANGDTIVAGADSTVFVSTNAGTSWQGSTTPTTGIGAIDAVLMRDGRLYAGTFGKGVFVSDDLGATWSAFNQGLTGGILDSQRFVTDLEVRDDTLFAATGGAGVYARSLAPAGTWQPLGAALEPNQAANVNSLTLGGTRLIASAGANGQVFLNDPGDLDWTISNLDNIGIHAGLQAQTAVWNGAGWVIGTNLGVFSSVAGQEPWTRFDPNIGALDWTTLATRGRHLFVAFDVSSAAVIEESDDDGVTWHDMEVLPNTFVIKMAVSGGTLFAARGDGVWRRTASTSTPPDAPAGRLRLAVAGPQPFADQTRLRFELPAPGNVSIRLFDVLGRETGEAIQGWWPSGAHEVSLDARGLRPGVYAAELSAAGRRETVRLVHVR